MASKITNSKFNETFDNFFINNENLKDGKATFEKAISNALLYLYSNIETEQKKDNKKLSKLELKEKSNLLHFFSITKDMENANLMFEEINDFFSQNENILKRDIARVLSSIIEYESLESINNKKTNRSDYLKAKIIYDLKDEKLDKNTDIYDSSYIINALGNSGVYVKSYDCLLIENKNFKKKFPGTTALVLRALFSQVELNKLKDSEKRSEEANAEEKNAKEHIIEYGKWLLEVSYEWKYPATTSLVLRSLNLIYSKEKIFPYFIDLIEKQDEQGSWNNLNTTVLILIAIYEFLDYSERFKI